MLPAHLTETLNNLGEAAKAMTEEVRADREQRAAAAAAAAEAQRKYNLRTTVLLAVIAVLIVALAGLGLVNRKTNVQNAEIIREIKSCTTAGGACYERSNARTNEAIGRLLAEMSRAQIAIAVCAHTNPGASGTEIEACAAARIAMPSELEEPPPSGTGPDGSAQPSPEPTS